jgi:LAO/AO transport system kinase
VSTPFGRAHDVGSNDGDLVAGLRAGDRRALARAITLVESSREDHAAEATEALAAVLPATGGAVRVGISGPPGVGKSTFIEALGTSLTAGGTRLAVLAVDPSSSRSGGSILGDKTRMERLNRDPAAFVRPSPSGTTVGGVARRTREALLLCEAAGFDVVLVETVGVGQSDVAVADMVDTFVLLVSPGGGDELQGIKRGAVELADLVVVTKADGPLAGPARQAEADHRHALGLLRPRHPGWQPPVLSCSARTGAGVDEVWAAVLDHRRTLEASGTLVRLRADQARAWLWAEVRERLLADLRADPAVRALAPELERRVTAGDLAPPAAARELLAARRRPPR